MLYLWNFIGVEKSHFKISNVMIVQVYGLSQIFCSKSKSKFYLKEVFVNVFQAQSFQTYDRLPCQHQKVDKKQWLEGEHLPS